MRVRNQVLAFAKRKEGRKEERNQVLENFWTFRACFGNVGLNWMEGS
jgi:hypothetical protein